MTTIYLMYGIATISIVLGFVALLTQRVYIDRETQQQTELDVPFLGKMKTNYPALIFVVMGFVLAYTTFDKSYEKSIEKQPPKPVEWTISGSLQKPAGNTADIDWAGGTLHLAPSSLRTEVSDRGTFTITAKLDDGVRFEDAFERITYSHPHAAADILPKNEYEVYKTGQRSLIEDTTKTTRKYRPKTVEVYE